VEFTAPWGVETRLAWEIRGVFGVMEARRLSEGERCGVNPPRRTPLRWTTTNTDVPECCHPSQAGVRENAGRTFRRSETRQSSGFTPFHHPGTRNWTPKT